MRLAGQITWDRAEAADYLNSELTLPPFTVDIKDIFNRSSSYEVDFSEVKGQEHVKRALEVAAAGGHNIITVWTQIDRGV